VAFARLYASYWLLESTVPRLCDVAQVPDSVTHEKKYIYTVAVLVLGPRILNRQIRAQI